MAGGPPVLQIGAEGALGFVKQSTVGTPVSIPSNAKNWVEFTAIDLNYDAAQHAIETGAGTRATERKAGRGASKSQGGFTTLLQPTAGAAQLAYALGTDTYATSLHTIAVAQPQLLTVVKIMSGQALQYQDVMIDTLMLAQAGPEWTAKYTIMGGKGDNPIASPTLTLPTDTSVFAWGETTVAGAFDGSATLTSGEISAFELTVNNNIRPFPGAGSYDLTKIRGGRLQISGKCTFLYDSAAAAKAQANYINGTEAATLSLSLTVDVSHSIVVNLANVHLTAGPPKQTLPELVELDMSFFVRAPEGTSIVIANDDASQY